MNSFRK